MDNYLNNYLLSSLRRFMNITNKYKAEYYQIIGVIVLIPAILFFVDGLINLQLIGNIIVQMLKPHTLLAAFDEVTIGSLTMELTISSIFIVIGFFTIIEGIIIKYQK
jgi:hypothetical protein